MGSGRTMAAKLEKLRLKQAKEQERYEAKRRELENEMQKGKKNLKTIQSGLKNKEIIIESDISSHIEKKKANRGSHRLTASFRETTTQAVTFPIPSAPRVSDWCYTAELNSAPPVVKSNKM